MTDNRRSNIAKPRTTFFHLRSTARNVVRPVLRQVARYRASKLLQSDREGERRVGRALLRVLHFEPESDEAQRLKPIEELRENLLKTDETISFHDFGAGSPSSGRSEKRMTRGVVKKISLSKLVLSSKSRLWSLLLYGIIREFQPERCLELGTCLGISAAYQARALSLNGKGHLTTIEGSVDVADWAKSHFEKLNVSNVTVLTGRFADVLPSMDDRDGEIDYVFIDGHHDENATVRYFEILFHRFAKHAVIVVDDIRWSSGMYRAWQRIIASDAVASAFDFRNVGVVILGFECEKRQFRLPLY